MRAIRLAVGAMALSVVIVGCAADPSDVAGGSETRANVVSNKITGSVEEWKVSTSAGRALAGEVEFAIANFGTIQHEFLVVKTDIANGKIPLGADNRFSEEGEGLTVIDEISEWAVDEAKVLKVTLDPGRYELLCNIAGHYANGMHIPFVVEKGSSVAPVKKKPAGTVLSNAVTGSVKEWEVDIDAAGAAAGDVTFTMTNNGSIQHEFLVVKTDIADGKIPLGADNRFSEEGEGLAVIDEIPEWNIKETKTLTVKLDPGNYQLLCNIEGHYANGMHTVFVVS
jgi:uncharacterized cupredoxin-like copper-binding protein